MMQVSFGGLTQGFCWGQGRQCGSTNNIYDEEEPAYENEQDTERERERERERESSR